MSWCQDIFLGMDPSACPFPKKSLLRKDSSTLPWLCTWQTVPWLTQIPGVAKNFGKTVSKYLPLQTALWLVFFSPVLCPALQYLPLGTLGQCSKVPGVPRVWETVTPGLPSVWWSQTLRPPWTERMAESSSCLQKCKGTWQKHCKLHLFPSRTPPSNFGDLFLWACPDHPPSPILLSGNNWDNLPCLPHCQNHQNDFPTHCQSPSRWGVPSTL